MILTRVLVPAAAAVAVAAMGACGPATTFTPREGVCAARPPGCEFDVISRRTERHFQVIGTIDVEAFSVRRVPSDEAAFREVVGPAVCRAGGDAVIPGVTGDGRYVLAAVVKWVDEGTTAPVCVDREHPRGEGRPARDSADSSEPHGGSNVALCAGGPSC